MKTAFEVRISDWSSDVCSSDLWRTFTRADANDIDLRTARAQFGGGGECGGRVVEAIGQHHYMRRARMRGAEQLAGLRQRWRGQIGRASCRERGWQYV